MRQTLALIVVVLVVGVVGISFAQTTPSLQGVWRVTELTVTGANASTNKSPQPSLFIFTKQHYSIVTIVGTAARKNIANPANPDKLTDAEKLARYEAWDLLTANAGTYDIKGSTLTTHPTVAKNPGVMGVPQTREFKIDGSILTLTQKSPTGQPVGQTTTRLTRVE